MYSYYTAILILCWITLFSMCVLVYENDRIPRNEKRLLYLTYSLLAVSAFAEWCGVWLDGRMDFPGWTLKVVKCVDYVLTPMAAGALIQQMHLRNWCQRAINIILIINAVLQLISVPGGWIVEIDAQNHYSHGPLYPVYICICFSIFILLVVQFALYGRTFRRHNRGSLYVIMLLIVMGIAIQEYSPDYRTSYLGMTIGMALLFIHHSEFSQQAVDEVMADQRIQLMLSQIRPHFLYNTLGSIEALCERDPKAAKMATRKFSQYLRGNMDSLTGNNLIPFETELQHTRLFLELEQIRFGEALRVEYDIQAHSFFLPPLTLEPIAENAVKHGIRMNADGRGTVSICTMEREDCFELQVTDDGPGFEPGNLSEENSHIGIRNVRERLDRICGGTLTIEAAPERGTAVTISIPKERKP